jgi:hypothetical protein
MKSVMRLSIGSSVRGIHWRQIWTPIDTETMKDQIFLSTLSLILAINLIDMLPNATIHRWTWLLAGALLGRSETMVASPPRPTRGETDTIGIRPPETSLAIGIQSMPANQFAEFRKC